MWHLFSVGEFDVTSLSEALAAPRPAVSQYLAKLRPPGLVDTRRAGRHIYYSVNGGHVRTLINEALEAADHHITGAPATTNGGDFTAVGA